MSNVVYSKGGLNIYDMGKGYVVHNTAKVFVDGHTHVKKFKVAKYLVEMVSHKRMPRHLSRYLLFSLVRLSGDEVYTQRVLDYVNRDKSEIDKYINVQGKKFTGYR